MKKKLNVPKFKNEAQERAFWTKVDLSRYFDAHDFESVAFPNLKPASHAISLRLPSHLFIRVKEHANELRVPYQALIKKYIAQGVAKEK